MGTKRTSCGPRYRHRKVTALHDFPRGCAPSDSGTQIPPPPPPAGTDFTQEVPKDPILERNGLSWEPPNAAKPVAAAAPAEGSSVKRSDVSSSSCGGVSAVRDFPPGCGSKKLEFGEESTKKKKKKKNKNSLDVEMKPVISAEPNVKKAFVAEINHEKKLDVKHHSGTEEAEGADGTGPSEPPKDGDNGKEVIVYKKDQPLKIPSEGAIICGLMAAKNSPWSNKKKVENKSSATVKPDASSNKKKVEKKSSATVKPDASSNKKKVENKSSATVKPDASSNKKKVENKSSATVKPDASSQGKRSRYSLL